MAVNRILYFYLLLLIFLFFVLFDLYLFHLLFLFLLLLPALSVLLALPLRRAVRCRLDVEDEIIAKGRCSVAVTAENAAPLPCACVRVHITCRNALGHVGERYASESVQTVQFALGARRSLVLRPSLRDARCGRTDFIIHRLEVCDLLGLISLRAPMQNISCASGSVYVLPALQSRTLPIEDAADIGLDSASYSVEKPGGDPAEVFQLRDYREGDPLRSVHWKLSGRVRRLIVRDFGLPLNPSLHFLLELNEGASPEAAEEMLGAALAFCEYLLAREVVHCLSWLDGNGLLASVSVTDTDALATALHSLLALPACKRWQPLTHFATRQESQPQTHLVYLVAGADWDAQANAEAERLLASLLDTGACRRITLMPDACPPDAARALAAIGCEVQLLDGRMPDAQEGAAP